MQRWSLGEPPIYNYTKIHKSQPQIRGHCGTRQPLSLVLAVASELKQLVGLCKEASS